jgi:hypothetical protein
MTVGERTGLYVGEFATTAPREELAKALADFQRQAFGSEGEPHPDLPKPIVLLGEEAPAPAIRERRIPRLTYRQLEKIAEDFEDALRQVGDVGRTKRVATVPETVYLDYSTAKLAELRVSAQDLAGAVARRNAVVPGGTYRTEGSTFPVQVTGEFGNERERIDTVVSTAPDGTPTYLRDAVTVVRGYENPIGYHFGLYTRDPGRGPLHAERAVLVSVEMREGAKIGTFYEKVKECLHGFEAQLPGGASVTALSNQPESVRERIGLFSACFIEAVVIVVLVALLLMDMALGHRDGDGDPALDRDDVWRHAPVRHPAAPDFLRGPDRRAGHAGDVPVVVSDGINRELHHGEPRECAGWLGPQRADAGDHLRDADQHRRLPATGVASWRHGGVHDRVPAGRDLRAAFGVRRVDDVRAAAELLRAEGPEGPRRGRRGADVLPVPAIDLAINSVLARYRRLLEAGLRHPAHDRHRLHGLRAQPRAHGVLRRQFFPPADRAQFLIDVELPRNAAPSQLRDTRLIAWPRSSPPRRTWTTSACSTAARLRAFTTTWSRRNRVHSSRSWS